MNLCTAGETESCRGYIGGQVSQLVSGRAGIYACVVWLLVLYHFLCCICHKFKSHYYYFINLSKIFIICKGENLMRIFHLKVLLMYL